MPPAVEAWCPKHWTSTKVLGRQLAVPPRPRVRPTDASAAFPQSLSGTPAWPLAPCRVGLCPALCTRPPGLPPQQLPGPCHPCLPRSCQARPIHRSRPRTVWGRGGALKPVLTQTPFLLPASLTFLPGIHRNPGRRVDHAVPGLSLDRRGKRGAERGGPRLRCPPRTEVHLGRSLAGPLAHVSSCPRGPAYPDPLWCLPVPRGRWSCPKTTGEGAGRRLDCSAPGGPPPACAWLAPSLGAFQEGGRQRSTLFMGSVRRAASTGKTPGSQRPPFEAPMLPTGQHPGGRNQGPGESSDHKAASQLTQGDSPHGPFHRP